MSYNFETDGVISFSDGNKAGSTYSGAFALTSSSGEWDTYETNFGEVSLFNAVNTLKSEIAAESLWDRSGTVLSPQTAGDQVSITGTDETAAMLSVSQTPTSSSINTVVQITALGNQWTSGAAALRVTGPSSDALYCIAVNNGSQDNLLVDRNGTIISGLELIMVPYLTEAQIYTSTKDLQLQGATGEVNIKSSNLNLLDNDLEFRPASPSTTGALCFVNTNQTNDGPFIYTGTAANSWVLTEYANRASDHGHSVASDPTLIIHDSTDPDTDDGYYVAISYSGILCGMSENESAVGDFTIKAPSATVGGVGNPAGGDLILEGGDQGIGEVNEGIVSIGPNNASHAAVKTKESLFVGDYLEVDGLTYHDASVTVADDKSMQFGDGNDFRIFWSTSQVTANTLLFSVDSSAESFVVVPRSWDYKDFKHTAQPYPTFFIHSDGNPDTLDGEHIGLAYNNLTCGAMSGDFATFDFTIGGSNAYVSATGGNRDGGDIILKGGIAASGGIDGHVKVGTGTPTLMDVSTEGLFVTDDFEVGGETWFIGNVNFGANAEVWATDYALDSDIWNITNTAPSESNPHSIMKISAEGGNFPADSYVLQLIVDTSTSMDAFAVNNGSTDTFSINRAGDVNAAGSLSIQGGSSTIVAQNYTGNTNPVARFRATPSSSSTQAVVEIEATGPNFAAGGSALKLINNDSDIDYLILNNGTGNVFSISQTGNITLHDGGLLTTTNNGVFEITPNGTGYLKVGNAGTPSQLGTTANDDIYVSGRAEIDGLLYAEGGVEAILGATEKVLIDAATTVHTGTAGALDIDFKTATDQATAAHITAISNTIGALEELFGLSISLQGHASDSATAALVGIEMVADAVGSAVRTGISIPASNWTYGIATQAPILVLANANFTLGAAEKITVDASTTTHTDINGALDISVKGGNFVTGIDTTATSSTLAASTILSANRVTLEGHASDSATAILAGLYILADGTGAAQRYGVYCTDSDIDYALYSTVPIYVAAGSEFVLGATDKILIDASTTTHTGTAGVLDLDITTVTNGVSGVNIDLTSGGISSGAIRGMDIDLSGNAGDSGGIIAGISLTTDSTGSASKYGIMINDPNFTYSMYLGADVYVANATVDVNLGATDQLVIDAFTTVHTQTQGALDINLKTATSTATGIALTVTSNGISTGNLYGMNLSMDGSASDTGGSIFGIRFFANKGGGTATNRALYCTDADVDYMMYSSRPLYLVATDIQTDTSTGMKIGTSSAEKIGIWGATPVGRPSAYTQTYSTADKTHAARTAQALTDSSGGTASQTIAAITGGGSNCENATKDAIASLADDLNKLRDDQLDTAQVLNALIDDLQAFGAVG